MSSSCLKLFSGEEEHKGSYRITLPLVLPLKFLLLLLFFTAIAIVFFILLLLGRVLPPFSNSWIILIVWLYIALNRSPRKTVSGV